MAGDELIRAARAAWDREEWGSVWKFANEELNEHPDRPEALYLAGCALRAMGHVALATTVYRRALAFNNAHINLWMHYAACLHDLHQWDEAREAFMLCAKQIPHDPSPPANIASGYAQQGRPREAVEWAQKALALDPDHHIARVAHCFGSLGLGRWTDGWRDSAWLYGHQVPIRVYRAQDDEEPMWDGTKGQVVVVQADQGLGDQIMFAQCLPQLIADCKQVIIECAPRLASLFRRNWPLAIVQPTLGIEEPEWPKHVQVDAHVHISWLGKFYRNRDQDFPRKAYLTADPERVAKWREWLQQFPGPTLGLAWEGGLTHTQKATRSAQLAELEPVMQYGGTLIDLSYQDHRLEIARWNLEHPDQQVICPPLDLRDYDDTVALAVALDDIVTVTTTLAHVCGALGRHAYVLVPQAPQWRYQHPCGDGLWWYPDGSAEMCRQVKGETSWLPAIARVAEKMARVAKLRRAA
jgi:tetratricopeptide (TPR) repeat protein